MLKEDVKKWNELRKAEPDRVIDLSGVDLSRVILVGANLSNVNLSGANFMGVILRGADLRGANLTRIMFWDSIDELKNANIYGVNNPPGGFIKFAKAKGAFDTKDSWEWLNAREPLDQKIK